MSWSINIESLSNLIILWLANIEGFSLEMLWRCLQLQCWGDRLDSTNAYLTLLSYKICEARSWINIEGLSDCIYACFVLRSYKIRKAHLLDILMLKLEAVFLVLLFIRLFYIQL